MNKIKFPKLLIIGLLFSNLTLAQEARLYQSKGNKFNPSIGINSLFLYQNNSVNSDNDGFQIQEMEMQFVSDVDSYFLVNALLAIRPEEGEFIIEPEEAFVETTSLSQVTFRVGKFRMAMGKHNQRHTHAYPFIKAPLAQSTYLGEEGLQETGVSMRYLVPTPWYQELTLQVVQGDNEDLFNNDNKDVHAGLVHLANFFELTSATTMEVGLSGMSGGNDNPEGENDVTHLLGADLTFKWKPSKGNSRTRLFI